MNIGIAFDLKSDHEARLSAGSTARVSPTRSPALSAAGPDDRLEEYDSSETVEAIARALA